MAIQFTAEILKLGVPTMSGKIYNQPVIQRSIDSLGVNPKRYVIMGVAASGMNVDIEKVCGVVDQLKIENGTLMASIRSTQTPMGTLMEALMDNLKETGGYQYGLNGYGTYEADGKTVKDFSLISISLIAGPTKSTFDVVKDMLTK